MTPSELAGATTEQVMAALGCKATKARKLIRQAKARPAPSILVVGDAHFAAGQDMRRATALGRFIRAHMRPGDAVVSIGDWFSLDALCGFTKPLEREGGRLKADLDAGNKAIRMVMDEMGPSRPDFYVTLGNHELRIERLASEHPELAGLIGAYLFEFEANGWTVKDFCQPLRLHGWRFQHYYQNAMGRAISSDKYTARRVLDALGYSESVVHGHTHKLDYAYTASDAGGPRHSINVGWFAEHHEDYAGTDNNARWWSGLVLLENVSDGDADIRTVRMSTLLSEYL
jgi:UDP-2,3-diacylglucosamine pyrophosphatase LpxH